MKASRDEIYVGGDKVFFLTLHFVFVRALLGLDQFVNIL